MIQRLYIPEKFTNAEVWQINISSYLNDNNQIEMLLNEEEKRRAKRYIHLADRIRFIKVRSALRTLLGQHLLCSPQDICFEIGAFGKPLLHPKFNSHFKSLFFNVSHSKDYALIALSEKGEVGIDIEYCHASLDIYPLAEIVLTHAEYQSILTSSNPTHLFFRYWVGKESLLKALGLEIGKHLKHIALYPRESEGYDFFIEKPIENLKNKTFSVYQLNVIENYVAALTC